MTAPTPAVTANEATSSGHRTPLLPRHLGAAARGRPCPKGVASATFANADFVAVWVTVVYQPAGVGPYAGMPGCRTTAQRLLKTTPRSAVEDHVSNDDVVP
jgi:hypothetical protein